MADMTITCPKCSTHIPLTESLAAPLLKTTKEKYEQELAQKDRNLESREQAVRDQQAALQRERAAIDDKVAEKLNAERKRIASEEAAKAKRLSAAEVEAKAQQIADLSAVIADRDGKLAVAQKAQADLVRKERELDDARREMELTVQSMVQAELGPVREKAKQEADDAAGLRVAEKDDQLELMQRRLDESNEKLTAAQKAQADVIRKERELDDARREMDLTIQTKVGAEVVQIRTKAKQEAEEAAKLPLIERDEKITAMQRQIEELKRKAEQGSQQLQGEAQELHLESLLRAKFTRDMIEPVPKGEFGGDVIQRVIGPGDQLCGTMLWESKRTKNFSDMWLAKLREDQRKAAADVALIVTSTMPKGGENFQHRDGIWVIDTRCVVPVATMLRQSLIDIAAARQASEGQQTKMELMYQYLTGPQFRHRVSAVVERFLEMQSDLDKERRFAMKQFAKRRQQIDGVIDSLAGMVGDMQGIAGKAIEEIEALAMPLLERAADNDDDRDVAA